MGLIYRVSRAACRVFFRLFGAYEVHGLEKLPRLGPVILASNHQSHLDPPLLGAAMRRPINPMAKEELFRVPLFGWWITHLNAFPVKRGVVDRAALRKALDVLSRGQVLLLFPEGTRSPDGSLGALQPGIGMIALKSHAPVYPVFIDGTREVLPRGAVLPRRAKLHVYIGDPLDPESLARHGDRGEAVHLVTEEIRESMLRLQDRCRSAPAQAKQS